MKKISVKVSAVDTDLVCGGSFSYISNNPIYPLIKTYSLGTSVGSVKVTLTNIRHSPVKIIIYIEGGQVLNSAYYGNPNYQSALNDYNNANGYPGAIITDDGIDPIEFTFAKADPTKTVARVELYAPLGIDQDATNNAMVQLDCPI